MLRFKKFFVDLFRANEQVPLVICALLIMFSYDVIGWFTGGQGATYTIPLVQAVLISALIVLSALVFARWVIKWQWKALDKYLNCEFDKEIDKANSTVFMCIAIGFTLFIVFVYCEVMTALIS